MIFYTAHRGEASWLTRREEIKKLKCKNQIHIGVVLNKTNTYINCRGRLINPINGLLEKRTNRFIFLHFLNRKSIVGLVKNIKIVSRNITI